MMTQAFRRGLAAAGVAALLLAAAPSADALVTLVADPAIPNDAIVETLPGGPEIYGPAARNLAGDRQLRQAFKNPETFIVGEIMFGFDGAGTTGGIRLEFFEVDDVNAGTWTPGSLVETITIPVEETIPATDERLSLVLTESNLFTLPARGTAEDTLGYAIQFSVVDMSTNHGGMRHSNNGTNIYEDGAYYDENGNQPGGGVRDFGIWLLESTGPPPVPGDTDGDMIVELEDDLNPIRMNYNQVVDMRADGDLNGDDFVDFADFRQWKTAFLGGGGSLQGVDLSFVSAPEPSALCLLLLAIAPALGRRTQR